MHGSAVERSSQGNHEHTRFAVVALFDTQPHESNCCVLTTMAMISPDGISYLLRRMVADEAGYIGLSRTVCKDVCVTSKPQVWVLLKEGFTERFRPA